MRKKILVLASALMIGFFGVSSNMLDTYAQEETGLEQDYSYLLTSDAIIGNMNMQTKGIYLSDGMSVIRDAGTGKIAAGGITTAAKKCDVTINVIIERLEGSTWNRVTSWTESASNAYSVAASRVYSVGRGYYYRVRCLHFANTDASSSMTDGLWR